MQSQRIKQFSPLNTAKDASDDGHAQLRRAENLLLRPFGGFKRPPKYSRLWSMSTLGSYKTALGLNAGHQVALIRIANEGRVILAFLDCATDKSMGMFYAGDLGTHSGDLTLTAGSAALTVLGTGYTAGRRWYGSRFYQQLYLGNGVDPNLVFDLNRTPALRVMGSTVNPARPLVQDVDPLAKVAPRLIISGHDGGDMTFVANDAFASAGNDGRIQVAIAASGADQAISSTRTGTGAGGDPWIYTITTGTGTGQSAPNSIYLFVIADPNAQGLLTMVSQASTVDDADFAATAAYLTGSLGTGGSVGFSNVRLRVKATYFDPGVNKFGYESAASAISTEVIIPSDRNADLAVRLTGNTSGDHARFGFQRVYLSVNNGTWTQVATTANTGTPLVRIGTDSFFGPNTHQYDQSQPPPCTMFKNVKNRTWFSGNDDNPERVWISAYATLDQVAPEGCDPNFYISLGGREDEPGSTVITAIVPDASYTHVHSLRSIAAVEGTSLNRNVSSVASGAVSDMAWVRWPGGNIYFLGADLVLYQVGGRVPTAEGDPVAPESLLAIRDIVGRSVTGEASRCVAVPDFEGQMLWFFMPGTGGQLLAFVYDLLAKGLVGPIYYPRVSAWFRLESADNRLIIVDEAGNLLVMDWTAQGERLMEFPSSAAFTYEDGSYTPPDSLNGFPVLTTGDGKLKLGHLMVLETGMMDMGRPEERKALYGVMWSTPRNARGHVTITATSDLGHTVTRVYGDVYGRDRHKLLISVSGGAFRLKFECRAAEDRDFTVTDVTLLFEIQGRV